VEAEEHAVAQKEGLVEKELLQNGEVPLTFIDLGFTLGEVTTG